MIQTINQSQVVIKDIHPNVVIKKILRKTYTDFYFTITTTANSSVKEITESLYMQAVEHLKENRIQIIQEKIHGKSSVLPKFKECRKRLLEEAGLDATIPFTYVEGLPLDGQPIVSLQIWGISTISPEIEVSTDSDPETPARVWKGKDYQYVYYPQIDGLNNSQSTYCQCGTQQCKTMFQRATTALGRYNLSFKDVARTWIYSNRLLDWYGELNRVRTDHFRKVGLYAGESKPGFPASTGIQGRNTKEECFFDVFALDREDGCEIEMTSIMGSSRQDQAFDYGSSFSRAMLIDQENFKTLYISGTAAINSFGESIYIGDAEMQALNTIMNIAALIEDQGGTLNDITSGVVYCKNHEVYETYKRTLDLLGIPEMPLVCVEADVCRHELLIEIEAVAVIASQIDRSTLSRANIRLRPSACTTAWES